MINQRTLIIGANSGIATALTLALLKDTDRQLILITRNIEHLQGIDSNQAIPIHVNNYDELSIKRAVSKLQAMKALPITQVFICSGILHSRNIKPEKRLEDFDANAFSQIINANTLSPILWLKHLTTLLTSEHTCKVTVFSARVGSTSDNKLGGWYSYRSSKAALNMLLKTVAIEFARRAKNIKVIAFHPGTTDTPLSKPFQKNVPVGKLFTREFVAKQLLDIVEKTPVDGELSYLDWQGKHINF